MSANKSKCKCGGEYEWNAECGAAVCDSCSDHHRLARCYCGWSKDGGDGYQQLKQMGETIEPEDSY